MSDNTTSTKASQTAKLHISLDLRLICAGLLLVIIAMLAIWMPWNARPSTSTRTITVTGESTIKSAPDVFVFSPNYETTDADKAAASAAVIAKQEEVVAGLKKLGVIGSKIKTDTGGYNSSYMDDATGLYHYSTNVQVTIDSADKTLTQKVQDYLVTTTPTGALSPYGSFSDALRKKLESRGRDAATKEARAKAEQSAKNLGFKVGAVKSVDDGATSGGVMPMYSTMQSGTAVDTKMTTSSLSVQPGEDSLSYSVTVVYYLR